MKRPLDQAIDRASARVRLNIDLGIDCDHAREEARILMRLGYLLTARQHMESAPPRKH